MQSQKEDFLNQLQFEIGHRWPNLDIDSISTISDLVNYISERHQHSKWPFLRFIPIYSAIKQFISNHTNSPVSADFDLNSLDKEGKRELNKMLENNHGTPLTFRRPSVIQNIVFLLPILLILLPLLISTYLITARDMTGWLYLSGLIGLLVTIGAFKITKPLKNQFSPKTVLEYSKAFYVVNNQLISENPSEEAITEFLCDAAERFYKMPFKLSSEIPVK